MNRIPVPPRLTVERVAAVLLVLALVGAVLGGLASLAAGTTYTAQREVLVRVWSIDSLVLSGQTADITAADLSDAATIMRSDLVVDEARSELGADSVARGDLAASISAVPAQASNFVEVTVSGPSAEEADRRAQATVAAFVLVVRDKVLATARQLTEPTTDGTVVPADIAARAQAVAFLDPVQVYTTSPTSRSGISTRTLVASGAVAGLGLGALLVVLLAFAPARLRRPEDVFETLGLPGAAWSDDGVEDRSHDDLQVGDDRRERGVPAGLLAAARHGVVAVCPARPDDEAAAHAFASWLVADVPGATAIRPEDTPAHGLVILDPPALGMVASRVPVGSVASLVLVTATGVSSESVARARDTLDPWRAVDAVVLVG